MPMSEPLITVFIIVFIAAFLCGMAWVMFFIRFTRRLQNHPKLLANLGKMPSVTQRFQSPEEIRSTFRLIVFLWKRQYKTIRNTGFSRQADFGRKILIANMISLTSIIVLLPFLLSMETSTTAQRTSGSAQSALSLYKAGEYDQALVQINQGLDETPDNADLLFTRGLLHEKNAAYDLAYADFDKVAMLVPDHLDTYLHLDFLLARNQRLTDIIVLWNRFLQSQPDHGRAYLERGGASYRLGDFDTALADALKSCELGYDEGCLQYDKLTSDQP